MKQGTWNPELFNLAVAEHKAGRLARAEALYRQILAAFPNLSEALHALGVLAYQTKRFDLAESLIAKAIQLNSNGDQFHTDHAIVLTAMGRNEEALQARERAAALLHGIIVPDSVTKNAPVITNPLRTDGFGAQFQTIIYAAIYAELTKKKFVYTPFNAIEHNYDNDPDFVPKKEELINFIGHFELNQSLEQNIPSVFFIQFFEANLQASANSHVLKKIREIFRMNKTRPRRDGFHVAVHIRRTNTQDNRIDGSNTPDSIFIGTINTLRREIYKDHPIDIHVYSQGAEESFAIYKKLERVHLHLNEPLEKTFTDLVFADALVTSQSSLSYVAALLSQGEIFYLPFRHPPLDGWYTIKEQ